MSNLNLDRSIHPRVVGGRAIHEKVNTSKPHRGKGILAHTLKERDRRRTDMAGTISRNSKNPLAYKMPGSMKAK